MERVNHKAVPSGGYVRVYKYVDGKQVRLVISVNTRHAGQQIADALNEAYAAGVARGSEDGIKKGRDSVADMLDGRFNKDGYGDWQDGWRAAGKEARQHVPGSTTSL